MSALCRSRAIGRASSPAIMGAVSERRVEMARTNRAGTAVLIDAVRCGSVLTFLKHVPEQEPNLWTSCRTRTEPKNRGWHAFLFRVPYFCWHSQFCEMNKTLNSVVGFLYFTYDKTIRNYRRGFSGARYARFGF